MQPVRDDDKRSVVGAQIQDGGSTAARSSQRPASGLAGLAEVGCLAWPVIMRLRIDMRLGRGILTHRAGPAPVNSDLSAAPRPVKASQA